MVGGVSDLGYTRWLGEAVLIFSENKLHPLYKQNAVNRPLEISYLLVGLFSTTLCFYTFFPVPWIEVIHMIHHIMTHLAGKRDYKITKILLRQSQIILNLVAHRYTRTVTPNRQSWFIVLSHGKRTVKHSTRSEHTLKQYN